jgi:hypothetical protein
MIKKLSIFMLLMALFAPWAANAQETVTIGDGTSSNPTLPVHMVYAYSLTQQIFTADEIGMAGSITSIAFYHNPTSSLTMEDIQVYMMQVDKSVFASQTDIVPLTNATKIFEGTLSANGTGWVTLQLSTPFQYNGESNLLVCCFDPNSNKPGSSEKFSTTSTGDNYTSLVYYSNSVVPNLNDVSAYTGTKGWYKYRNNIQLEITPNSCQTPTSLNVTLTPGNGTTALLSWTSDADAWQIMLNDDESNIIDVTQNPYTLTGLTPETTYTARVRTICGGEDNMSFWSNTVSFTPSEIQVVTIGSGETTTNNYLPAYTLFNNTLSEQIYTAEEVGMAGTINSISFYNGGSEKSPEIKIYMVNTDQTEFSSDTDWLSVTANDLVYNGTVTFTVDEWTTIELDTPFEYDGTSNLGLIVDEYMQWSSGLACRVFTSTSNCAMYVYSDGTDYNAVGATYTASNRLSVKNQLKLEISPTTCPRPTNVSVSNITSHEATINWEGTSDSYNVYLGTEDIPSNLLNVNFSNGIPSNWSNNSSYPWTVTNGYIKSGNAGVASSTSTISVTVTFPANGTVEFDAQCMGEGTSYDVCKFLIDNTEKFTKGENGEQWDHYTYNVTSGQHTFTWSYTKDSSVDPDGDYFAIDNVVMKLPTNIVWSDPLTVENTEYTFNGLTSETTYFIKVQSNCGEEGLSTESAPITFTTEVSCPAPTDINVTNVTGRIATINWTGSSDSYIVMIGTENLVSNVDFETGDLSQDDFTTTTSYPWTVVENAHSGAYCAKSGNGGNASTTSDMILEVTLATEMTLSFSAMVSSESDWDYGYFLIDGSQQFETSGTSNSWTEYSYPLTAGSHTLIWRYYKDSSGDYGDDCFYVDDIIIKAGVTSWTEYSTTETTYTFNNLTSSTSYQVKVKGDCGEEGMSAESDPVTFITDVTCPAPSGLEATNVTSNSAMLHWTGDAESYNVSYYKAYFFDSFEEDLSQWTIYKEGDDGSWEWGIENPHDNSADLNAHSGNYAAVAYSDIDVHADSWLVSPQILFPNQATLKFWIMRSTYDDAQDEYEVRLSTTGNAIEDFTTVLKEKEAANSTWTEVSIDLSAYDGQQGYIAIRHDFTGGFFIMVDDFGIYGWSEEITTIDNSLLIEDLLPETEYLWQVQANCGDEDGQSSWASSTFTTLPPCPIPFDLTVSEITANGATIAWTGYNDSYEVVVGQLEMSTTNYDFEDHTISADFTNTSSYPWTAVQESQDGSYCMKSGNGGVSSSTSSISLTMTSFNDGTIEFDAVCMGEGTSTYWDHCDFSIDGTRLLYAGANISGWNHYSYEVAAGEHTFTWSYTKDSSVDPTGDYFAVDNIIIQSSNVSSWLTYSASESPFILNDAANILPETTYSVKVIGFCEGVATEDSEIITFTTLDENTKIFVIEGDWSDGDNWVPAGVPSIDESVILRAEATVFDVAEANAITIEGTAALIIEDGGQLKTNADIEATMKKFIIGYGTDYVETNNGYYLMALPTAAPISAADAGLITEESDYDLYGWDRTAIDEEWQNNHEGIDLQNGIGFLYANRDDMEMSFTATLRNSSEPVVVTPAYDEVEHGGWNLCGNPFPCEAYITTDAEGMVFYRLVDNALVPIEGSIAPLEAFFVKATAAGQTFTISREAPAK